MNGEEKPLVGLWFLKDMFVASCLFVLLGRLWNGNFIIYGVLILFISFCLLHFNPIGRINTGRVCLGLFYICLGFNLKKIENCIFDIKLWQTICLLIVTIIFSFRFYNKGEMINLTAFQMPIFVLGSFSGIILLLKVSNILLKNNKATTLLSLFGNNSMTILVWHALSFKVANAVLIVIYNFDWTYMSYYFTIPIKEVENYYWILYSICGLIVPISILIIFEKIKIKIF